MCKLNRSVLSHMENDTVTFHIYRGVVSSMSVAEFEEGFRHVAAVAPPRAAHQAYYYRHRRIKEIAMKFVIEHDRLRVEFGTYDRFEKELQPILGS